MGKLTQRESGREHVLAPHTLVGRGSGVHLRLRGGDVSSAHSTITWTPHGWRVRDLGSRNGTWLNGSAVPTGRGVAVLEGAELRFGAEAWTLTDDGPPAATASCNDIVVEAIDGVLLLPDADRAEAFVYHDDDLGWVVEVDEQRRAIDDGDEIEAGGSTWQLVLPEPVEATFEANLPELETIHLHFAVSRDEEHVQVSVAGPDGWSAVLPPRSYHYMLLTLARLRLDEAGAPAAERGWVFRDDLCKMLRVSARTLTVHLCRAHRQLADAGVLGASDLFEYRPASRLLRLRTDALTVSTLSDDGPPVR